MTETTDSDMMKCPVCRKGKWKVKTSMGGIGLLVILFGWILAIPTCTYLESAKAGPGFFGLSGGGIIVFVIIIVIAHLAARPYKRRHYECFGCGHIMK